MIDNPANCNHGIIESDTSDFAIKVGDRLFVSNGCVDIAGEAMIAVYSPYDDIIKIREADGTEITVKGWQAIEITINGIDY